CSCWPKAASLRKARRARSPPMRGWSKRISVTARRGGCWERRMTELLAISGLHAGYGATEILRGVSVAVNDGEIVAVLGSNGAGKSTLNRAISGVLMPWRGGVGFSGGPIQQARAATIVAPGLRIGAEG